MITEKWATVPASGHANSNCAQTRRLPSGAVELRNDRELGARLAFTEGEWRALVQSAKDGDLDI